MILEVAILNVKTGETADFEAAFATASSILVGKATKFDEPCLLGVQRDAKLRESLA